LKDWKKRKLTIEAILEMILKRYFGLNNEAIFFNNCDGVLRIGREEEHIALSVSGTKLLKENNKYCTTKRRRMSQDFISKLI